MKKLFLFVFVQIGALNATLFETVSFWWQGASDEVITHEHTVEKDCAVKLENKYGDIVIKTWKRHSISLEATKKGTLKALENTEVSVLHDRNSCSITTKVKDETLKTHVKVNYVLMVPSDAHLKLISTDKGSVFIRNTQKPVAVSTSVGSIELVQVKNSVHASTRNGSIKVHVVDLAKDHTVVATTEKGNITIQAPEKVNAHLFAHTTRGKISTMQPVTLEPRTMTISAKTIAQLRKDVQGVLGEGGAHVKLHSKMGSIFVVKA